MIRGVNSNADFLSLLKMKKIIVEGTYHERDIAYTGIRGKKMISKSRRVNKKSSKTINNTPIIYYYVKMYFYCYIFSFKVM